MCRLLIADDNRELLGIRKLLMEAAGHEVALAENVSEACRLLGEWQPEVLLMDLHMPKLRDGLSLIRSAGEQGGRTGVIVLSGWTEELCDRPEEKLVASVLPQPLRNEYLLDAINEVVSSRARSLPSSAS